MDLTEVATQLVPEVSTQLVTEVPTQLLTNEAAKNVVESNCREISNLNKNGGPVSVNENGGPVSVNENGGEAAFVSISLFP